MDRAQKKETVEELGKIFTGAGSVIVCHYAGLTVSEMEDLRGQMRAAGGSLRVAKNRLAKIALQGQPNEGLALHLAGQTILAYGEDPITPAKVVEKYAKGNEKLKIVGGAMGSEVFDAAGVVALAKMPSREEVLSSIVGAICGPGANLVGAITGPATSIAGVVKTIAEREDAE